METLHKKYLESNGVCIDTRKIVPGQIFFALHGENFDGNKFAKKAIELGATLAVIDDKDLMSAHEEQFVLVDDTYQALVDLAKYHRASLTIPVIGITGSNGKTTTKELLHAVLSTRYKCSATVGNFNNHIGVPLTLLGIGPEVEIAIVEMGANHIGEIEYLAAIAAPTHGLITNIGKAHLEGFGGIEGVRKGKSELYRYLSKTKGNIFVNESDEVLSSLVPVSAENIVRYKANNITVIESFPSLHLKVHEQDVISPLTGAYNVQNIAAAIAIGKYFKVPINDITKAISNYTPKNNRSQILKVGSNIYILDSYNANPSSMLLSIENLAKGADPRKSVLILGDMKEVGNDEVREHEAILKVVMKYPWKDVFTVGSIFSKITKGPYLGFESVEQLNEHLQSCPLQSCFVLLKASRSIGLDQVFLH